RLELVVGHDVLEVGDLAHHRVGLGVVRAGVLEVRAHAAAQRGRLADVDDLGLGVAIDVDAGAIRDARELVVEAHVIIVASARGRTIVASAPARTIVASGPARVEAWVACPRRWWLRSHGPTSPADVCSRRPWPGSSCL